MTSRFISILYPFVTFDGRGCFHFAANRESSGHKKTRHQVATRGTLIIGGIRHCLIAVPSVGVGIFPSKGWVLLLPFLTVSVEYQYHSQPRSLTVRP